jgi:large repetitive protein
MRCRLVFGLALLVVPGVDAAAQVCSEFLVNTHTTGTQRNPSVATAANGDFVVAWESYNSGGDDGIFGRLYQADGSAVTPEFRINTSPFGHVPHVARNADGSFVVVWAAGGGDVRGQRFDSAGTPQGPELLINTTTTGEHTRPAVAADAAGNFVVVWQQHSKPSAALGQRFDAAGVPQGAEFQVDSSAGPLAYPAVSARPGGGFVVAWNNRGAGAVWARRFDAAGAPLGAAFHATGVAGFQDWPQVAHGPNDDFVVVWENLDSLGTLGVAGRAFDSSGTPRGPSFQINTSLTSIQERPAIAATENGYVVAWHGAEVGGAPFGVFARRLDSTGVPVGGELTLNIHRPNVQQFPSIAAAPDGGFVAAWESGLQDGSGLAVVGHVDCSARFHAVTPCRVADTRVSATPLAADTTRLFPVTGTCDIPADARAVAVNVTAVSPTDAGNLRVLPGGAPLPLASSLNFAAGRTRSNNALVAVGTDGQLAVRCDMPGAAAGSTHLVLDVFGYFKR